MGGFSERADTVARLVGVDGGVPPLSRPKTLLAVDLLSAARLAVSLLGLRHGVFIWVSFSVLLFRCLFPSGQRRTGQRCIKYLSEVGLVGSTPAELGTADRIK